jgi:hypothetical protein
MSDYTPTPEAVEAAARALWASCNPNGPAWRATSEEYREQARSEARKALTAAGPLIAAEALRSHRRRVARFMPAGLVDRATVLADLDDYADRIARGEGS